MRLLLRCCVLYMERAVAEMAGGKLVVMVVLVLPFPLGWVGALPAQGAGRISSCSRKETSDGKKEKHRNEKTTVGRRCKHVKRGRTS